MIVQALAYSLDGGVLQGQTYLDVSIEELLDTGNVIWRACGIVLVLLRTVTVECDLAAVL